VLRSSEGKHLAVVHDAIVVPPSSASPDQVPLARAELARALEFARDALNSSAIVEVRELAIRLGIDHTSLSTVGIEDDLSEDHDAQA
jgi:hypothetical protein